MHRFHVTSRNHPRRHGRRRLPLASRPRGRAQRPARRRFRHVARRRAGAPPPARRPRRPPAPRLRRVSPARPRRSRVAHVLRAGRPARRRAVQARADADAGPAAGPDRTHRPRQFRRSLAGQGGSRRPRRDQPPRKNPTADAAVALRRDARRRGHCAHGRRHPTRHPRDSRRTGLRRRGLVENRHRRRRARRPAADAHIRPADMASGKTPARAPAPVFRHRLIRHARPDAREKIDGPR